MYLTYLVFIASVVINSSYQQYLKLPENSPCTTKDGVRSVCKTFENCPTAEFAIKNGNRPSICTFDGQRPVICCPTNGNVQLISNDKNRERDEESTNNKKLNRASSIARQKCNEYAKSVRVEIDSPVLSDDSAVEIIDTCAIVEQPLVVGGENANPREFPHMALVGFGEKEPNWLCGGSLISLRFVLSAAHCSDLGGLGPALWIKLGDLDISTDIDDADPKIFKIIRRINHRQYDAISFYNDITLFKLDREVQLSPFIRPLCLNTEEKISQNRAIASGWGHTSWGGQASPFLMKVELPLVNNKACNRAYNKSRIRPQGILEDSMICAGSEVGKDTCQGDSGGPLQVAINEPYCMYRLLGITSNGGKCANGKPAIYTRVSHFLPWIVQIVWPE